jgi:serine/threonine protein phosphatase PrpC
MGPKGAAERFIQMANSRGGRDNITAVVITVR